MSRHEGAVRSAATGTAAASRTLTPLVGLLVAQAISLTGTRVSMVAIPWFVLSSTGSASRAGLVAFAELAPYVLVKALGGPALDRWGARRVSVAADVVSVAVVAAIPLCQRFGQLSFPALLLLVAVAGAIRGPGDGAKQALIPSVVASSGLSMERAAGLSGIVDRLSGTVGAAVAGVLVAAIGPISALAVDVATFAVAAVVLAISGPGGVVALVVTAGPGRAPTEQPAGDTSDEPYLTRLRAGWNFLRRDRVLIAITAMVAVTNLLDQAYLTVFAPVWAAQSGYGPAVLGTLFATFSAAALVGSLIATAVAQRLPRRLTFLVAFVLVGAPRFIVLAIDASLPAVLMVAVVAGFSAGFLNPILSAVIFERIPAPLVGRVTSLNTACCWALLPFGGLLAGALIGSVGLAAALTVFGLSYFVATTVPALLPQWHEIDRRPAERLDSAASAG